LRESSASIKRLHFVFGWRKKSDMQERWINHVQCGLRALGGYSTPRGKLAGADRHIDSKA
jgi:hypothetical protein